MVKCSALFCGLLLILSIVQSQQLTNAQSNNINILNRYCQPAVRNTLSTPDAFRRLCQSYSATECCSYISALVKQNPNLYLCSLDSSGYTLTHECRPTAAINNEQIDTRISDSSIVFRDDQYDSLVTSNAQQYKSTAPPRINSANRSEYSPVQVSSIQKQSLALPQQLQQDTFLFNFGNPQDAVQVPISSSGSSQRPNQQANKLMQSRPSNVGHVDDDYEDDRVVVETGTAGYQATEFALNLFKNLVRSPNSDSIISPLLPQLLLSSLVDYASPVAQTQLKKTILLHPSQLASLSSKLERASKSTVNTIETASANFIAQDVNLNKTYASDVATRNVDVKRIDFNQPQVAARTANNWVSGKTHNLINEILNPSTINPYTRLLLVNTIYFKGMWKYTFIESNPGLFEASPNNPRQLNKMYQLNKLRYGELSFPDGNGLRWVELPYEGNSLSMIVFLPTARHQLEASIRQLTPYDLAKVMAELQSTYINTKVHLNMPKFTLTDSISLIPALKRMGLNSIFQDPDALQYITNESTVVSDVTQRSYMSVDEYGTKATSVASLSIITLSITPQYKDVKFDVDQPFLTMIVDKQERYPFFIGQINNPRE